MIEGSYATAIGPYSSAVGYGDFAVSCREDREQLLIHKDGTAEWIGEMSLAQAASGAASTLLRELWSPDVGKEFRCVALARLYDRMHHAAREASLLGARGAEEALTRFRFKTPQLVIEPSDEDTERSIKLAEVLDDMHIEARRSALVTLLVVGLDPSRKAGNERG